MKALHGRCASVSGSSVETHSPFAIHCETAWQPGAERVRCAPMGHCKGKDNVKKRAVRRKKTERLALAKSTAAVSAK